MIAADNAASLQVWQTTRAQAPGRIVWEAGGQALAVSGKGGVGVYRLDPLTVDNFFAVEEPWFVDDIAANGLLVAKSAFEKPIVISDAHSGQDVLSIPHEDWFYMAVALTPDGRAVSVGSRENLAAVLFSVPGGAPAGELTGFQTAAPVYDFMFSPSGEYLVWISRGTVQLMDIASQELMPALNHEDFVVALDVTRDDRRVATSAYATVDNSFAPAIYLWDSSSGERLDTIAVSNPVYSLSFSPDGRLLAADSGSGVDLWDMDSYQRVTTLQGHSERVVGLAFSPDGRSLATVSEDGVLVVWRAAD